MLHHRGEEAQVSSVAAGVGTVARTAHIVDAEMLCDAERLAQGKHDGVLDFPATHPQVEQLAVLVGHKPHATANRCRSVTYQPDITVRTSNGMV